MVVVMGIAAVLTLLSATAFITVRDKALVDQTAENIVSDIRDAQNRAFSVELDGSDSTKAWGVKLNGGNGAAVGYHQLVSYYMNDPANEAAGLAINESRSKSEQSVKIRPIRYFNGTSGASGTFSNNGTYYLVFTSPFAETYLFSNNGETYPCGAAAGSTACHFRKSTKPTEEWDHIAGTSPFSPSWFKGYPNGSLVIEVTKGIHAARVIVRPNGDTYIE
jgi:Tfp pilus assembly protein FimT